MEANILRAMFGPDGIGGDLEYDPDTNAVTGLGTATGFSNRFIFSTSGNGIDGRGYLTLKPGTWKVRYNGDGTTPDPTIVDQSSKAGLVAIGPTTAAPDWNGKKVRTIEVSLSDYLPAYPDKVVLEFDFSGNPSGTIPTGVELLDPDTPADWDKTIHPDIYNRDHGLIACYRFMDPIGGNGLGMTSLADYSNPDAVGLANGRRYA